MSSHRVLSLLCLVLLIGMQGACRNRQEQKPTDKQTDAAAAENDEVTEAHVLFVPYGMNNDVCVGIYINSTKLIDSAILSPIKNAKIDPTPAKYVILGGIVLKHKNGSETTYTLFDPWGNYQIDGKDYIANFKELGDVVKDSLAKEKLIFLNIVK
jgi:hypothetical protein